MQAFFSLLPLPLSLVHSPSLELFDLTLWWTLVSQFYYGSYYVLGVSGKQPPPDRQRPNQSLMVPQMPKNFIEGGAILVKHNIELMRKLIEHMEHGNIRIRKLNAFRLKRRLTGPIDKEVSSDKEEELIPTISSFLTSPTILWSGPNIAHTTTTQKNTIEQTEHPSSDEPITRTELLGNNWAALVVNSNSFRISHLRMIMSITQWAQLSRLQKQWRTSMSSIQLQFQIHLDRWHITEFAFHFPWCFER